MPRYWITRRYVTTYNRLEPVEAESEQAALDLVANENGDADSGLYEQYSSSELEDTDVNPVEEGDE